MGRLGSSTLRRVLGRRWLLLLMASVYAVSAFGLTASSPAQHQSSGRAARRPVALGTVNLASLATNPDVGAAKPVKYTVAKEHDRKSTAALRLPAVATLGGATSPASDVTSPGNASSGLNGVGVLEMEKAGTGKYAGTNGGLEPPDQALCVGNGYVMEGVNTAYKVFTTSGAPVTPAVPITQFFKINPAGSVTAASFVSDPRCVYDPVSKRFFALTLQADEATGPSQIPFTRSHTYFAVSKTSDPSGDWFIYSMDITDDGLMGTPLHTSCPCIDDQPLMGLDKYGLYISSNEYSNSEIIPVPLPPQVGGPVNTIFGTLPDYRNGQAQVYGLSKALLIGGTAAPIQAFDTANVPLPAEDQGKTPISVWSSLQPATSPPGDTTPTPVGGAEYFMSQMDFQGLGDHRIAVWAMTNTSSLSTATPAVQLKHTILNTLNPADTYTAPSYGVDQKNGPHPLGDACGCPLEQLNANDDRMNAVMLTNGALWGAVNTSLPAQDPSPDLRAGIMYFKVQPALGGADGVSATMLREGYVQVARNNVIFPVIAASPQGPVGMFFTLAGPSYFPSAAWTRLDGLGNGAPAVHISGVGTAPEDGFTGYPLSNQVPVVPLDPQQGSGVSRWGDYGATAVDEQGCMWGASEYITDQARDTQVNWGTFITRIQPDGCSEPALVSQKQLLNVNACLPAFTDPAGDDELVAVLTPVPSTRGQNPQLDIIAGNVKLSADGQVISTVLTINNLTKTLPSGGQANDYYMYWTFKGVQYYTLAEVSSTGAVSYVDGINGAGGRSPRSAGPADTGSFVEGKNGQVTVNVPVSVVGNPHAGNLVQSPNAETRETEGLFVLQYDVAGPSLDVVLGAVCTPPAAVAHTNPVTVGNTAAALPNTSGSSPGRWLGAALVAAGAAALLLAHRRRGVSPNRS